MIISQNRLFVGYSTLGTNTKVSQFSDIQLVNRDLLVAFYTRPGERLMMPTYGCKIWSLLFEQFNESIESQIISECQRIVAIDTRLQLIDTNITTFEQGIQVQLNLLYVPYNVVNTFTMTFDQASALALQ